MPKSTGMVTVRPRGIPWIRVGTTRGHVRTTDGTKVMECTRCGSTALNQLTRDAYVVWWSTRYATNKRNRWQRSYWTHYTYTDTRRGATRVATGITPNVGWETTLHGSYTANHGVRGRGTSSRPIRAALSLLGNSKAPAPILEAYKGLQAGMTARTTTHQSGPLELETIVDTD